MRRVKRSPPGQRASTAAQNEVSSPLAKVIAGNPSTVSKSSRRMARLHPGKYRADPLGRLGGKSANWSRLSLTAMG
jgi:antitoxin (DNA-binding transcriptional repressor) of toxin-antitoxin stability system